MGNAFKKKKEPIEKIQYFSYLNKVKNQHFKSILNNGNNNNKMALQKKDFEKIRTVKLKYNDSLKIKDVDWLIYISKYFHKKYKISYMKCNFKVMHFLKILNLNINQDV